MELNRPRKVLEAKGITLGCGKPKICIPIVGENVRELLVEVDQLPNEACDIVEWRVDFLNECEQVDQVLETLSQIRNAIKDKPLIFTFRNKEEGGQRQLTDERYFSLLRAVVHSRLVEYIDVELAKAEEDVQAFITTAHKCGCYVIVSNHEFTKTPTKEIMAARLLKAIDLGADVPKLAVMPQNSADVLSLLEVTLSISEKSPVPIVTMAMGKLGALSRVSGSVFGSAMTFAAGKKPSAPGQFSAMELKRVLDVLEDERQ